MIKKSDFKKPRDAAWYRHWQKICGLEPYDFFVEPRDFRDRQIREFQAGKIVNPRCEYPRLDRVLFGRWQNRLEKFYQQILSKERDDLVREVYLARVTQKIKEVALLQAATRHNQAAFIKLGREIYGWPTVATLNCILSFFLAVSSRMANASVTSKVTQAAAAIRQRLGNKQKPADQISREAVRQIKTIASQKKNWFLSNMNIGADTIYGAPATREIFKEALQCLGASEWTAVVARDRMRFAVNHQAKRVLIPARRSTRGSYLQYLILHEIGVHVLRRINGERSPLKLLGSGLAHYMLGEEGLAVVEGQVLWGARAEMKHNMYFLAAALAAGLDGKPRDFRQTYEAIQPFAACRAVADGHTSDELEDFGQGGAYHACESVFRGTDGVTPGLIYPKDILYAEGARRIWQVIETHPEETPRFYLGKYDPANIEHRRVLDRLGSRVEKQE